MSDTATDISLAITFPADQYVTRGVYASTRTNTQEWADTFWALGGQECGVIPGWRTGIEGTMTVLFSGTQAALDHVLSHLTA